MPVRPVALAIASRSGPHATRRAAISVIAALVALGALTPGVAARSPVLQPPAGTGVGRTVLGMPSGPQVPGRPVALGLGAMGLDGASSPADAPTMASEPTSPSSTPTATVIGGVSPWSMWSQSWQMLYTRVVPFLYEPAGGQDGQGIVPDAAPDEPTGPAPKSPGQVGITIPENAPVPRGPGVHRTFPDGPPPLGTVHGRALEVDDARLTLTAEAAMREGLLWPVYRAGTISQLFHAEHPAIDISAPMGTPLLAPYSGIVVFRRYRDDRCANAVWIKHGPRFFTSYCHLWRFSDVQAGDWVEQGEVIGYLGNGGYSTGPHVHFGVSVATPADWYVNRIDPLPFLRQP